jgi:hypothetical protein
MTNIVASGSVMARSGMTISAARALRVAWISWIIMLVIPFFLSLAMIWRLAIVPSSDQSAMTGDAWFLTAMLYLLVVVPGAFFWRGHVFKAYWTGQPVTPERYLFGMLSIWVALVVGGVFSLIGCFVTNSPLPNLLPALVAFMFFVTLWPSGRAMIGTVGDREDPQAYEEPR